MKSHSTFELSYTQPSSDWKSHTLAHTQRHTYGGYLSLRKFRGVTGSGIAVRCGYDGIARRLTDAAFWYPVNVGDVAKLHTLNYVHSFCSVCVCVCVYIFKLLAKRKRQGEEQAEASNGSKQMAKFK